MPEYQQRVIDEQIQLAGKLVKLIDFTLTPTYRELDELDRNLLVDQRHVMSEYNEVLSQRIARFTP